MENVIIIIGSLILVLILFYIFKIDIKKIKKLAKNKKLNEISNKFPDNETICKEMLKVLNNETVNIKYNENSKDKTSLYVAVSNTIFIANIKNIYTRIQTIAHECLHSVQDKKILMFNFVFTNIYAIYFIISIILTLTGVFKNYNIQIIILLLMGFLQYIVRSYLETDAMTKARFLAEDYMKKYIKENYDENEITIDEVNELVINYDKINKIGIPTYNFILAIKALSKPTLYAMISLILSSIK